MHTVTLLHVAIILDCKMQISSKLLSYFIHISSRMIPYLRNQRDNEQVTSVQYHSLH